MKHIISILVIGTIFCTGIKNTTTLVDDFKEQMNTPTGYEYTTEKCQAVYVNGSTYIGW